MKIVAVATNVIRSTVEWAIGAMYSYEYVTAESTRSWKRGQMIELSMVCRLRPLQS